MDDIEWLITHPVLKTSSLLLRFSLECWQPAFVLQAGIRTVLSGVGDKPKGKDLKIITRGSLNFSENATVDLKFNLLPHFQ